MQRHTIDPKYTKFYKTVANLDKALEKAGIADHRHLLVYNEEGKVTAVFPQSNFEKYGIHYLGFYGQYGFYCLG